MKDDELRQFRDDIEKLDRTELEMFLYNAVLRMGTITGGKRLAKQFLLTINKIVEKR